jgi:hypothetical protein
LGLTAAGTFIGIKVANSPGSTAPKTSPTRFRVAPLAAVAPDGSAFIGARMAF